MTADLPEPAARPVPTEQLDASLKQTLKRFHRLRWIVVTTTAIILVAALATFGLLLARQQSELQAACGFYRDLAGISVRPSPPVKRPSRLIVTLITHSRIAYIGLACSPQIPRASPSLVYWAGQYHINVP